MKFNGTVETPSQYFIRYGKKRLITLAEYIRKVPKQQFQMKIWWRTNCKTVGCAMGHACSIPQFKRAGLKLELLETVEGEESYKDFIVRFKDSYSENAAADFFGISWCEADLLFMPYHYPTRNPTPKQVSAKILDLIKQKEKLMR